MVARTCKSAVTGKPVTNLEQEYEEAREIDAETMADEQDDTSCLRTPTASEMGFGFRPDLGVVEAHRPATSLIERINAQAERTAASKPISDRLAEIGRKPKAASSSKTASAPKVNLAPKPPKPAKSSKGRDCLCGCGEQTGGGRFRPGHDAKLKGRLLKAARDESKPENAEQARRDLEGFGWSHFLTKSK